jgi:hypothetical protein
MKKYKKEQQQTTERLKTQHLFHFFIYTGTYLKRIKSSVKWTPLLTALALGSSDSGTFTRTIHFTFFDLIS